MSNVFGILALVIAMLLVPLAVAGDTVVSVVDDAEAEHVGVSVFGHATGDYAAVSVFGNASSTREEASGDVTCGTAVSGTGNATGCDAFSVVGPAHGRFEAVSVMGDASCWGDYALCLAASGTGETRNSGAIAGLSGCAVVSFAVGRCDLLA